MRPLIGCLQRRRHQSAARAAGTESRTQGDGRMAWSRGGVGSGRWCGGGMPRQSRERWGSWRRSPDEQRDSSLLETVAWLTKFT